MGGDLYDFFMVDDTHLAVVVSDVSGKGFPAAMFMIVAKAFLEEYAHPGSGSKEVLSRVNTDICRQRREYVRHMLAGDNRPLHWEGRAQQRWSQRPHSG